VPDFAICQINIRFNKMKEAEEIHKKIHHIMDQHQEEGIRWELHIDTSRPPKEFDSIEQKIYEDLKKCGQEINLDLQWRQSGGASDGNILSNAGLPTIDSLGVVGGGLHTHDEYMLISSLTERAKLTALYMMKLANKEINIPTPKG
jgi:glutamate carboxypeptidase